MEDNIASETVRAVELERALQQRREEVAREEAALVALNARLREAQRVRAERYSEVEAILAVLRSEERRLRDSEERLAMTAQHIEHINADSVAFDRHNFARMKEARMLDKAKAAMEVERGERRRAVAQFEAQKKEKAREREARNAVKEREVLDWMKVGREAAEALRRLEEKEEQTIKETEGNAVRFEVLASDIEETREERRRLEAEVERAKGDREELNGKKGKVLSIQASEDEVLQSLQRTHEAQQEVKRAEIEALDREGEAVAEQAMAVRRELGDVALQRAALEASQAKVMGDMQERLAEVVKEGTRHDEEMKLWMQAQREERERMQAELEGWKAKAGDSGAEQRRLLAELERLEGRRRREAAQQSELALLQQIATQNNNSATYAAPQRHRSAAHPAPARIGGPPAPAQLAALLSFSRPLSVLCSAAPLCALCSTVLLHLNEALHEAVQEYYARAREQQPFRQSAPLTPRTTHQVESTRFQPHPPAGFSPLPATPAPCPLPMCSRAAGRCRTRSWSTPTCSGASMRARPGRCSGRVGGTCGTRRRRRSPYTSPAPRPRRLYPLRRPLAPRSRTLPLHRMRPSRQAVASGAHSTPSLRSAPTKRSALRPLLVVSFPAADRLQ